MNEPAALDRNLPFWRFLLSGYREASSPPVLIVLCLVLYLPMGWLLTFHSNILDHPVHPWDLYFGFDTPSYVHRMISLGYSGGANANHPLLKLFVLPLAACGELLRQAGLEKCRTFLYVASMALLITGSVLNVAVYTRSILRSSKLRATLLAATLAASFSALTLSFTPESYPLSLYVLSLCILFLSREVSAERSPRVRSLFFWSALCGGVTISNGIKPILSALIAPALSRKSLKAVCWTGLAVGAFFTAVLSVSYSLRNALWHSHASFVADLQGRISTNATPFSILDPEWIKRVLSLFWGGPWYAPPTRIDAAASPVSILLVPYDSWPFYVMPTMLLIVVAAVGITMRNTPQVRLLLAFLLPDILIHVVGGWGLAEATMYASHWIFPTIALVAWGCHYVTSRKWEIAIDGILAVNLLAMSAHNLQALSSFISFARQYYPAL